MHAMTVGHCPNQLGIWGGGAISPLAGPGQRTGGGPGWKPPEVPAIPYFLRPENGLGSYKFLSVLQQKQTQEIHIFPSPASNIQCITGKCESTKQKY